MLKFCGLVMVFFGLSWSIQALEIDDGPHEDAQPLKVLPAPQPKTLTTAEILTSADENDIKNLLNSGFDVNARNTDGITPLIFVLKNNDNLEVARLLIENGADVNAPDAEGMTALLVAVSAANELQKQQEILRSSRIGQVSMIPQEQLEKRFAHQMERAEKMLKMLLEYGADVNQETPFGTPLMAAATNDWNISLMSILIAAGVKVNAQDINGQSALFYAHGHNAVEAEAFLIKNGADINLIDRYGHIYMDAEPVE